MVQSIDDVSSSTIPSSRPKKRGRDAFLGAAACILGVGALVGFRCACGIRLPNSALDLGTIVGIAPWHGVATAYWAFLGTVAVLLLTWGLVRLSTLFPFSPETGFWDRGSDRTWIVAGSVLGALVPLALRATVLHGQDLADDDSAYRFSAELLASGRLYGSSHSLPLFFDRQFMVNDGRMYSQYFLGWPGLMVPGVWLGMPELVNPVLSALTIPPLFLMVRRLAGSGWARASTLIYLTSPMLNVQAATLLSHTSCIAVLAWLSWTIVVARQTPGRIGVHAIVAVLFSVAFFIRPLSALAIGLPWLVYWALGLRPLSPKLRRAAWSAFAVPAAVMGLVFLLTNKLQNGDYTATAYEAAYQYARSNGFRFSGLGARTTAITGLVLDRSIAGWIEHSTTALTRLHFDLLGWPCAFVIAAFAGLRREAGVLVMSVASFLVLHAPSGSPGIDTFGPVHYAETGWPLIVLAVLGLHRLSTWVGQHPHVDANTARAIAPVLTTVLLTTGLLGYSFVRLEAVERIGTLLEAPFAMVERSSVRSAVIFAPERFVPRCPGTPRHFRFFRPNNDPDLSNSILWVNDLGPSQDRRLMAQFPGRQALVMYWSPGCTVHLITLEQAEAAAHRTGNAARAPPETRGDRPE